MAGLSIEDFAGFFEQVHDCPPFPWQERLARRVVADGWPDVLDLPTGSGKTSALDVALFALALDPQRAPRRTVLVVDRRVVVDQGAEHARRVAARLGTARAGVAAHVAERLRALWDAPSDASPFVVMVMRGGMPREDAWARRPDQPVIAVSTVDQVGSRLLFRGYGVWDRMASVHAGLLGNDTLFLLDEVHLAVPFAETLQAVGDLRCVVREPSGPRPLPDRWRVVRMSATPGSAGEAGTTFRLEADDRDCEPLDRRLRARKRARLVAVKVKGPDEAERKLQLAERCVAEVSRLVEAGAKVAAVVVNRVDTARMARGLLGGGVVESVLLTGRMRPLDRERVLDARLTRRLTVRDGRAEALPLVVLATQSIEAGADFDFDALVTECASLDALRQRFGRLDRRGELGDSDAVVLARTDQVGEDADDPVYGPALSRTWAWLEEASSPIDFGIDHLTLPAPTLLAPLLAPVRHAPLLLPAHLDAWVQTGPRPYPEPVVSQWLHGPERDAAEVQVVWRADVTEQTLASGSRERQGPEELIALLSACPPSPLEALTLPLGAARAWLNAATTTEVADVGATQASEPGDDDESATGGRLVLRWRGDDSEVTGGDGIRPGDTLVVPVSYGGIRYDNWDPTASDRVSDLGDVAQWRQRGRATLRLHPGALATWLEPVLAQSAPRVPDPEEEEREPQAEIHAWLERVTPGRDEPWASILAELRSHRRIALASGQWVLVARRRRRGGDGAEVTSEDDGASFTGCEVGLAEHSADVRAMAGRFCRTLGLPEEAAADVQLAAWLHDVGKADPRFQRMLVGGSEVRLATLDAPLAKSAGQARDRRARELARERSGYPKGCRHELLSVALAAKTDALAKARDPDLVLHLVGSHHGWCRPFAPAVEDTSPVEVFLRHGKHQLAGSSDHGLSRLDSGVAERFWDLVERYGWWGLAWFEAILRLADHRASEAEEERAR